MQSRREAAIYRYAVIRVAQWVPYVQGSPTILGLNIFGQMFQLSFCVSFKNTL